MWLQIFFPLRQNKWINGNHGKRENGTKRHRVKKYTFFYLTVKINASQRTDSEKSIYLLNAQFYQMLI